MRITVLFVVAAAGLSGCLAPEPLAFTLLTANVGNTLLECEGYAYNLCRADVEERVAERLASHAPDVVLLQEVVSDEQCDGLQEDDPTRACHPAQRKDERSQARRLLGDGYVIACDARRGFECVAVKESFGAVGVCLAGEPCDDADTPAAPPGCDDGFSVSAVTVMPAAGDSFRVVNAHPASGFASECRAAQLQQAFGALAGDGPALVAGDMNVDPFVDTDEAVLAWDSFVGDGARFRYHSGPSEHEPAYPTSVNPLASNVYDHVVSDFLAGSCVTLGEAPGSERLDGGAGMDHRALSCTLEVLASRPDD